MPKNTWIIGASSGIGAALAKELAHQGETLCISARNEQALKILKTELDQIHQADHLSLPCDVTNPAQIHQTITTLSKKWASIDRVIFMAGLYNPTNIANIELAEMEKIIAVNLQSAFYLLHHLLPVLTKQGHGQIALCASVAGYRGLPNAQPYGATKAGLINLTETLRAEHGHQLDIKVINPGFVKTRLTDKNDFKMPFRITPEQAAKAIAEDLNSKKFESHFPKAFTLLMKTFSILPNWLYFKFISQQKSK